MSERCRLEEPFPLRVRLTTQYLPRRHRTHASFHTGRPGHHSQKKEGMDVTRDGWFTEQAFELVGEKLSRPPAPLYEGIRFAVRDLFHPKPFAVHTPFHMPANYEMKVSRSAGKGAALSLSLYT